MRTPLAMKLMRVAGAYGGPGLHVVHAASRGAVPLSEKEIRCPR